MALTLALKVLTYSPIHAPACPTALGIHQGDCPRVEIGDGEREEYTQGMMHRVIAFVYRLCILSDHGRDLDNGRHLGAHRKMA